MLGSQGVLESVRRAGYLAYDNGVLSKHRGLFVDFDFQALLGSISPLASPAARGIRSEDQLSVDRYTSAFTAYADAHNVWNRTSELALNAPFLPAHHLQDCYNAFDRDVIRGMLHAEKQAKRPSGKYAWSPKLREAGPIARYWNLRLREADTGRNLRIPLDCMEKQFLQIKIVVENVAVGASAEEIKVKWAASIKALRLVRDAAYDHRTVRLRATLEHYQNLTFAADESGADENKEKIRRIQRLLNTEKMRLPFRGIHSMVTPRHGSGISKLFVPAGIKIRKWLLGNVIRMDRLLGRSSLSKWRSPIRTR